MRLTRSQMTHKKLSCSSIVLRTVQAVMIVRREGSRQVARNIDHYNLEAILALEYRVRSAMGVQFRRWRISMTNPPRHSRITRMSCRTGLLAKVDSYLSMVGQYRSQSGLLSPQIRRLRKSSR